MKLLRIPHPLLFLIASVLLSFSHSVSAQELSVEFEEHLVIGDQEDAPVEYLFGDPQSLITDSNGRVFVATENNTIRVFSPEGEYLKTIGREGKGPGEFLTITAMTFGHNEKLIVFDGRLRRITRFDNMGESVETEILSHPDWTGGYIIPLPDDQFATVSIMPEWIFEVVDDLESVDYEDKIIHLIDGRSWEKNRSLFDVYEHLSFDKNDPVEARFATAGSSNYRFARLNDSTLAITHEISDGSLYLMNTISEEVREVPGHFSGRESYEMLDLDRRDFYVQNRFVALTSASATPTTDRIIYQTKLGSIALISNKKWTVNLIRIAEGSESTFHFEFFDNEGNYLGYAPVDEAFTARLSSAVFYPMHLDEKDQFYYIDSTLDVPVIRVIKIIMAE